MNLATAMTYIAQHAGSLDQDNRDLLALLLGKLANNPDRYLSLIQKAQLLELAQEPVVRDPALNRAMCRPGAQEAAPAKLK